MNNESLRLSSRLFLFKRFSGFIAVVVFLFGVSLSSGCAQQIPHEARTSEAQPRQSTATSFGNQARTEPAVAPSRTSAPHAQSVLHKGLTLPEFIFAGEPFVISYEESGLQSLQIVWYDKAVTTAAGKAGQKANMCKLVLAAPLETKDSKANLTVTIFGADQTKTISISLPIKKRVYPVQRLTVAQKYVTPDPSVLERIKKDRQQMRAVLCEISPYRYWSLPFKRPVPGSVSSIFGLRRLFNGEPRNPHKGVDFRAKAGDPVAAIESGRVALVADHYYGGNTVVVDHGLGVFSLYLHLSAFDVVKGDTVVRGQAIGRIGSTGRSTGPHLHLSLAVLGEYVDAACVIEGMQKNFAGETE